MKEQLNYGVPLGSKVCILVALKIILVALKIILVALKIILVRLNLILVPLKLILVPLILFLVPLKLFLVRLKLILVPLKLFLVPLKIQTFEPIGTPQNGKQRCAYFKSANQSLCYKRHAIAPVPCKKHHQVGFDGV